MVTSQGELIPCSQLGKGDTFPSSRYLSRPSFDGSQDLLNNLLQWPPSCETAKQNVRLLFRWNIRSL